MTENAPPHYSISVEILHAMMIGIALSICGFLLIWLAYSVFTGAIFEFVLDSIREHGVTQTIAWGFGIPLLALFWSGVWFAVILVVALLQYVFIALPLAHYFSSGLEADSKRSLAFYTLSGMLIGGGPWLALTFLTISGPLDLDSAILLLAPGLVIGAGAGAILKHHLVKLAAAAGIENSIK